MYDPPMGRGRKPVPSNRWNHAASAITWKGPRLLLLAGIPGSGKSTWAGWIASQRDVDVISADQIRLEMWGSLQVANSDRGNHKKVFEEMHHRLRASLGDGRIAIADATNLYPHARNPLYKIAQETGAEVEIVLFSSNNALLQNRQRDEDQVVPEEAMQRMSQLLPDLLEDLRHEGKVHTLD